VSDTTLRLSLVSYNAFQFSLVFHTTLWLSLVSFTTLQFYLVSYTSFWFCLVSYTTFKFFGALYHSSILFGVLYHSLILFDVWSQSTIFFDSQLGMYIVHCTMYMMYWNAGRIIAWTACIQPHTEHPLHGTTMTDESSRQILLNWGYHEILNLRFSHTTSDAVSNVAEIKLMFSYSFQCMFC